MLSKYSVYPARNLKHEDTRVRVSAYKIHKYICMISVKSLCWTFTSC